MTTISGDLCEQTLEFLRVVIKITERSARMSEDLEGM